VPVFGQSASTAPSPTATFASPGTKQVSLQVCNPAGCNTTVKSVVVLDPMPAIVSMPAIPARLLLGQSFSFNAQTTGRPQLTHRWQITGLTGNLTLSGNPAVWNTASPGVGAYLVQLEVQNVDGTVSSSPAGVLVVQPGIFSDGFESGNGAAWQAIQ
jgi:PKD repeat protein